MKTKVWKLIKIIVILYFVFLISKGVFDFIDNHWNGEFINWFSDNLMETEESYSPELGTSVIIRKPIWWKIKNIIFVAFCTVILLGTVIAMAAANIQGKKKFREAVTESSGMIRKYMSRESEASEIFPKEYAEISTQMSEIKSVISRHEQMLKEEAARKNDLITYLAHDLKTPLTSVIGYLSLLDEAPDMPAEQKAKYVSISLDKALRLEKLINEFFEITRYNLQQIVLEKECTDISYMLVQMADEFYPILKAHGNTIEIKAPEDLNASVDPEKLARVFNNILKNAVAYSYPDTVIEIIAERAGGELTVQFCNRGKTIPKQKLESVFEKFFRLDDARSTNTGGAGLGLAIAKEIVLLHGGTITAESEDDVTTFEVKLPV